jgi:hypothetical protein
MLLLYDKPPPQQTATEDTIEVSMGDSVNIGLNSQENNHSLYYRGSYDGTIISFPVGLYSQTFTIEFWLNPLSVHHIINGWEIIGIILYLL